MVFDRFENHGIYEGLGGSVKEAFEWLADEGNRRLPDGTYRFGSFGSYAMVMAYAPKDPKDAQWETHRDYLDLQYVLSGSELFGCGAVRDLKTVKPYDAEKDIAFYTGEGVLMPLAEGEFFIIFPGEPHMPSLRGGGSERVRKIVVKIPAAAL